MLARVRFLSGVPSEVYLEVSFLKEMHFAEGAVEVGHLVQVSILLVEPKARVTCVRLVTALVRALEPFKLLLPFLLRKVRIFAIQFISALISCEMIVLVVNNYLLLFWVLLAHG